MKLKNLFWFATGASISYHLVKNRKEIKTEVTESSQLVKGIQDNLAKIQRNLDIIQDQKTNLQELVTDFQYKTKLFSQQAKDYPKRFDRQTPDCITTNVKKIFGR